MIYQHLLRAIIVAAITLSPVGLVWSQSVVVDVDPNGTGEFYPTGCFDVYLDFTEGGSAQSPSYRLEYDADLFTATSISCTTSPAVTHSVACLDGTAGTTSPNRTVSIIYGSTIPPSNLPTNTLGPIQFCVDSPWAGGALPSTESFSIVDASASIATTTGADVTITEAPAPDISVSPTSASFSASIVSTDSNTFTVTNSGNLDGLLISNIQITGTDASLFSEVGTSNCPTSAPGLAQGATCSVVVQFAPSATGVFSASLDLTSNAGTVNIDLSGTGTPAPTGDLTISPEPFNFGGVIANSGSDTQSFTVSSSGAPGSVVTFASPSASLSGSGDFAITQNNCTGSLVAGSTCSIVVTFTPTSLAVVSTTLTVSGTDANSAAVSDTTSISGEGTPFPAGDLTISPTSYDFGSVVANEGTPTYTFTITSSGDPGSTVDISTVSVTGNGDFAVTSENCLGALAQGASCTVTVTYSPSAVATDNATLTVGGTDENTDAYNASATLAGEGTPFPAGALSISPTSHDFGGLLAGVEDDTQVFTVTSSGDTGSEVTISSVSLSVTGGSYSVTANTCSGALAQGATCSITVEFDPGTAGIFNVSLDVEGTDENADPADVSASITGEGLVEARPTASPDGTNTANLTVVANTNGDASFEIDFGNDGNDAYFIDCQYQAPYDASVFSVIPGLPTAVEPGATLTATAGCSLPDTETYQATLVCQVSQGTIVAPGPNASPMNGTSFTYDLTCIGDATPIPATNRWGLLALALLMLGLAGWGVSRRAL